MIIYTMGYSGWKIEDVEAVLDRLAPIMVDVLAPQVSWHNRLTSREDVAHSHGGAVKGRKAKCS